MNVLLFTRSYENMAGGIEKMSLLIAKGLLTRGHKVIVASIDSEAAQSFYQWPDGIKWEKVSIGDATYKASNRIRFSRAMAIRRIAKENQIDSAIGFQVGAFALLRFATLGLGITVVAAERNSPTLFRFIKHGSFKRFFSNLILLAASSIAVQFPNYRDYYPLYLRARIRITPNPVIPPTDIRRVSNGVKNQLLFVGRLTYQKNLPVLIRALAHVSQRVHLTVIGEGPDYFESSTLALQLNLSVTFLPPTPELSSYYLRSDFLVLPSRWEGFPNVVAEALSFGLPVIGFQSCAGVPELVDSRVNGYVCPGAMNEFTLSEGINEALTLTLEPRVIANSITQYSYSKFIDCWEEVL